MFKALRREFMIVNSLLILTILYGALTAFYFVTWLRMEQSTTFTIAQHMSAPAYDKRDAENPRLFISTIGTATYEYIRDVPTSNIFKYFDTLYASDSFSTSLTDRILVQVVEKDSDSGLLRLDERYYKYVRQQIDSSTIKIVVLETTNMVKNLHSTRTSCCSSPRAASPLFWP